MNSYRENGDKQSMNKSLNSSMFWSSAENLAGKLYKTHERVALIESENFTDTAYLLIDDEIIIKSRICGELNISFENMEKILKELHEIKSVYYSK